MKNITADVAVEYCTHLNMHRIPSIIRKKRLTILSDSIETKIEKLKMSGIVSLEMYLALAEEKKALMQKSQFLEKENKLSEDSNETEVSDVSDVSDVSETIWSSPESGSMNGSESEPYIIENVPNKKLLQANKPFPATEKRNPDETSTVFVCRIHPCSNTTFESLDDHQRHLEINHPEKPYICSRCPFASHIPHRTLAHEKSHKTNEMVYRENHEGAYCRLCNIIFASSSNGRYKSALRQHQKQYH